MIACKGMNKGDPDNGSEITAPSGAIPNSVTSINDGAFSWSTGLTTINYQGSREQWDSVEKGDYWKESSATIHCIDD